MFSELTNKKFGPSGPVFFDKKRVNEEGDWAPPLYLLLARIILHFLHSIIISL